MITKGISDLALLDSWLKQVHGGRITSAIFEGPGYESFTFSDKCGPVMFVRFSQARRVDIQFLPEENPLRTAKSLAELIEYGKAQPNIREFLFDTNVPRLQKFMARFGVEPAPFTYKLVVEK